MTFPDPTASLSSRREACCRHGTASGNAGRTAPTGSGGPAPSTRPETAVPPPTMTKHDIP